MIEYGLKGLLLLALMLLHDRGLHLYAVIALLCVTFPFIEAIGKAIDEAIREERRRTK